MSTKELEQLEQLPKITQHVRDGAFGAVVSVAVRRGTNSTTLHMSQHSSEINGLQTRARAL